MTHAITAPASDPLPDLWEWAACIWREITSTFGAPRALAQTGWLYLRDHRMAADWVRHLERLVRRIVIVAALRLQLTLPRPARPAPPHRAAPLYDNPLLPQTWTSCFALFRQPPADISRAWRRALARARRHKRDSVSTLRLARRLESLRRIIAEPHIAARRVARALARLSLRSRTANAPCLPHLRPWTFAIRTGCSGARLIDDAMRIVQSLVEAVFNLWRNSS